MNRKFICSLTRFCLISFTVSAQQDPVMMKSNTFQIRCSKYGLSGSSKVNDTFPTNYISNGKLLGEVAVRYRTETGFDSSFSADGSTSFAQNDKQVNQYTSANKKKDVQVNQSFGLHRNSLTG